jgi:hypothetical protein
LDTDRRRVLIQENAVWVGGKVAVGTPKSHENRSVPYPRFLEPMLAELCAGKPRDGIVFGNGLTHQVPPKVKTGWSRTPCGEPKNATPTSRS